MENRIVAHFISENYGLKCKVSALHSYIDQNFLVETEDGVKYIFKLSSDLDSPGFLHAQNRIFDLLSDSSPSIRNFPAVIPSIDNKEMISFTMPEGNIHNGRLLNFVDGKFLAEVNQTADLLFDYGLFLGEMDKILQKAESPHIQCRRLSWDLQNFPDVKENILDVRNPEIRRIVRYFLMQFRELVEPCWKNLRTQTIHGDANDWNILVRDNRITGIIDFGDMVYSHTINELAIALTYSMMNKENPVETACEIIRGYHSEISLEEQEIEILYYLIASRLCISICMSASTKEKDPGNEYITISEKPAISLLEKWIEINPLSAENKFRKACGLIERDTGDRDLLIKSRKKFISSALSLSYDDPIRMEQAAFQYMYDDKGNTYLDCVNNICHVGHCHPKVVEAGQRQMAILNTNTRYIYDHLTAYAEKLCSTFPVSLNKVFFVNSGSAATDLALRLARTFTCKKDIVVVGHAYHGNTTTAIEISPYKYEGKGGEGCVSSTHKTLIPDTFRGKYRSTDPEAGLKYATEVEVMINEAKSHGREIAAFICESIIGCGGQVMLPDRYLREVYRMIRNEGGVCIADEVQVGFGRVGSCFWGFELQGVIPDIVIIGKPMGNGHPLAAVITTGEIARSFETGMEFFSSFGGNPVSCKIGEAVLDIIREEKLQENALTTGNYLIAELTQLKTKYPIIGDVRGSGLFLGIEFVLDPETLEPATREAKQIVEEMKERKILLSTDGPYLNVIKFKPPLVFSVKNARRFITELDEVLRDI